VATSIASDDAGLGLELADEAHAADDGLGHDVGIDGVVRARDAFLEGVELHLTGQ
jgi:hypothetical protein